MLRGREPHRPARRQRDARALKGVLAFYGMPVDVGVRFLADFEPANGDKPTIILESQDFSSRGMDTDSAGNFYVATGVGTSLCPNTAGALVVLSSPALVNNQTSSLPYLRSFVS